MLKKSAHGSSSHQLVRVCVCVYHCKEWASAFLRTADFMSILCLAWGRHGEGSHKRPGLCRALGDQACEECPSPALCRVSPLFSHLTCTVILRACIPSPEMRRCSWQAGRKGGWCCRAVAPHKGSFAAKAPACAEWTEARSPRGPPLLVGGAAPWASAVCADFRSRGGFSRSHRTDVPAHCNVGANALSHGPWLQSLFRLQSWNVRPL